MLSNNGIERTAPGSINLSGLDRRSCLTRWAHEGSEMGERCGTRCRGLTTRRGLPSCTLGRPNRAPCLRSRTARGQKPSTSGSIPRRSATAPNCWSVWHAVAISSPEAGPVACRQAGSRDMVVPTSRYQKNTRISMVKRMGVTDLKSAIFSVLLLVSIPVLLMKGYWKTAILAALVSSLPYAGTALWRRRRESLRRS